MTMIQPIVKSEHLMDHVQDIAAKISTDLFEALGLKQTENIVDKFRFGEGGNNFDQLLQCYFSCSFVQKQLIEMVDLNKFDQENFNIAMQHEEFISDAHKKDHEEGFGLPNYLKMEFDLAKLNEQLEYASPELAATFSFLGSQIWTFVNLYNDLTKGNNFDVLSNY